MQIFAELIHRLDQSNKTGDKLEALDWFFSNAAAADSVWVIAIFSHRRPKRQVATRQLRNWCQEKAGIPDWLYEESYQAVGDLAETIALLLPAPTRTHSVSLTEWIHWLQQLPADEELKKEEILRAWDQFTTLERFVFNKLITGGFRIGVSQNLLIQALASHGLPRYVLVWLAKCHHDIWLHQRILDFESRSHGRLYLSFIELHAPAWLSKSCASA